MEERKREREKPRATARLVRLNKESDNGSGWRCCRINQLLIHGSQGSPIRKPATPHGSQLIGAPARLDSVRFGRTRLDPVSFAPHEDRRVLVAFMLETRYSRRLAWPSVRLLLPQQRTLSFCSLAATALPARARGRARCQLFFDKARYITLTFIYIFFPWLWNIRCKRERESMTLLKVNTRLYLTFPGKKLKSWNLDGSKSFLFWNLYNW